MTNGLLSQSVITARNIKSTLYKDAVYIFIILSCCAIGLSLCLHPIWKEPKAIDSENAFQLWKERKCWHDNLQSQSRNCCKYSNICNVVAHITSMTVPVNKLVQFKHVPLECYISATLQPSIILNAAVRYQTKAMPLDDNLWLVIHDNLNSIKDMSLFYHLYLKYCRIKVFTSLMASHLNNTKQS